MLFKTFALVLSLAAVSVTGSSAGCNADNCLRAIRGTRLPGRVDQASVDCSAYLIATVSPSTVTFTVVVTDPASTSTVSVTETDIITETGTESLPYATTVTVPSATNFVTVTVTGAPAGAKNKRRQALAPTIPAYASPCSGAVRYSSACRCIGVTPGTITLAIPSTTMTVTVPATTVTETKTTFTTTTDSTTIYAETVTEALTTVTLEATSTIPGVQLSSPTAIFGDIVNGSPADYDDVGRYLTLPFAMQMYDVSSTQIFLDTNGFLSLDGTSVAPDWINAALPNHATIPPTTIFGLWDDLYIYSGTQQGIYYQIDGVAPSRSITFEYYTSAYHRSTEYYHFLMKYEEAKPNKMTFTYFDVFQGGVSATIGAQSANQFVQYSFDTPNAVSNGQTLLLDTTLNTITVV